MKNIIKLKNGPMPEIEIILVSHNSHAHITECLNSLKKQDYNKFNITLVDNNSSDDPIILAKKIFNKIKVISLHRNEGFAKGNNIGIKEAYKNKRVKYVVCLNLDTSVKKDWLKNLVFTAENFPEAGSVQSKVLLYNSPMKVNTIGNYINFLGVGICGGYLKFSKNFNSVREIGYASGSSVLFRISALKKTGLFDEDYFMYKEDMDLGWRLKLKGYKNLLSPKSVVYHKYHFSKNPLKFYYIERNRLITIVKNYKIKTLLLLLPAFLFFEIGIVSYSIFKGFFIEKIRAYFDFIKLLPKTLSKRKTIQKSRNVSDKNVVEGFISKIEFEEVSNPLLDKVANPLFELYWRLVKGIIK